MLLGGVRDPEQSLAFARGLERVSHHDGDELPALGDAVGLEDAQLGVVQLAEPRRVRVPEDREHPRQGAELAG